jgi:hypothetical protein
MMLKEGTATSGEFGRHSRQRTEVKMGCCWAQHPPTRPPVVKTGYA